jgi:hypothetical protein
MKKSLPPVDNSVWTVPSGTPTFYLAYQGITDAQTQFVEFIGNHSMLTSTGETALLTTPGILTIPRENLWTYPEIQEINRHKPFSVFNNMKPVQLDIFQLI